MAKTVLVDEDVKAGESLVTALDEGGIEVTSAFWFLEPEPVEWRLYLAMPVVQSKGPGEGYKLIQDAVHAASNLSLFEVSVVSPSHPLVKLLNKAIHTGAGLSGIRFSRNTVGGVFIEDAYIYRLNSRVYAAG